MMKHADGIADLQERYSGMLTLRVSLDHYDQPLHDRLRGELSWDRTIPGLQFLTQTGVRTHIAGRTCWDETEEELRQGFARLFARTGLAINADDPMELVLFPEMDRNRGCTGNYRGMLGHTGCIAILHDVRHFAHDREAQGRRTTRRPAVYAVAL